MLIDLYRLLSPSGIGPKSSLEHKEIMKILITYSVLKMLKILKILKMTIKNR